LKDSLVLTKSDCFWDQVTVNLCNFKLIFFSLNLICFVALWCRSFCWDESSEKGLALNCDTAGVKLCEYVVSHTQPTSVFSITSLLTFVDCKSVYVLSRADRRDKLCHNFFRKLLNPSNCIRHLLPPPHNTEITSRQSNHIYGAI